MNELISPSCIIIIIIIIFKIFQEAFQCIGSFYILGSVNELD